MAGVAGAHTALTLDLTLALVDSVEALDVDRRVCCCGGLGGPCARWPAAVSGWAFLELVGYLAVRHWGHLKSWWLWPYGRGGCRHPKLQDAGGWEVTAPGVEAGPDPRQQLPELSGAFSRPQLPRL